MPESTSFSKSFVVECDNCKKTFNLVNFHGLKENENPLPVGECHIKEKFYGPNQEEVLLTFFVCPYCNKIHFTQIDDAKSQEMFCKEKVLFTKLYNLKKKHKKITQKQSAELKRIQSDLSLYRNELKKKYTGVTVHSDNVTEFVLRFDFI